jgi:DNA replication initiation complex subunit (GINS family)
MQSQAFRETQKKYRQSEKGKAALKKYHQTQKFKESQKRYRTSDKAKTNRKAKPEIYMKSIEKMINNNVCNILTEHYEKLRCDPERLSTEYICKIAGIRTEKR